LRNRFALAFFVDRPTDAEISQLLQASGLDQNAADSIAAVSDGVRDAELRADCA
jgi:isopenicillin N synthase-like dioxygenase